LDPTTRHGWLRERPLGPGGDPSTVARRLLRAGVGGNVTDRLRSGRARGCSMLLDHRARSRPRDRSRPEWPEQASTRCHSWPIGSQPELVTCSRKLMGFPLSSYTHLKHRPC